jgi:hypothetical protein
MHFLPGGLESGMQVPPARARGGNNRTILELLSTLP